MYYMYVLHFPIVKLLIAVNPPVYWLRATYRDCHSTYS